MKNLIPFLILAGCAFGQYTSPAAQTTVTVAGKKITIDYHAPSMHNRKIFGELVPFGQVWRAGANEATALHTDATLQIKNLTVPKGNYTLFVWPERNGWQLIVNKQTGQWGLEYHQDQDLGRVAMDMSKAPAPIETFKITLTSNKLQMEWENTIASVPIVVK
jgi:hypothetical protein